MVLDGTVVSAAFDDVMDMGIVGTTAGTLWYINWTDNTSIRLISGHKSKVEHTHTRTQLHIHKARGYERHCIIIADLAFNLTYTLRVF